MNSPDFLPLAPDRLGDVRGWRAWSLVGSLRLPRLKSVNGGGRASIEEMIWPTRRWFTATCPRGCNAEVIPNPSCSCGLYAALDREHLIKLRYGAYEDAEIHAIGEVAFSGRVIRGAQGWRAEKGRIVSLVLPYEHWRYAENLQRAYNVPVSVGFLFAPEERGELLRGGE